MNLQTALLQGAKLLEEGSIAAPRLTAEVLLSHAVHCERTFLYAHPERELKELEWIHYGRYLHERLGGKPTQYITGRQEFYGREFRVTPSVLIPRPETEHLVEVAVRRLQPGARLIDAGCGSGAIAATLSLELRTPVFAGDISPAALSVAQTNAQSLHAEVNFVAADLLACFAPRSFDAVVSNPPYVPLKYRDGLQREVRDYEPEVALFGGESGNEIYARIVAQAAVVLKPGGLLLMELGFGSLEAVRAMVETGWREVAIENDLAGIPRVLAARLV